MKKSFYALLVLLFLVSPFSKKSLAIPSANLGDDVTHLYHKVWDDTDSLFSKEIIRTLRSYRILLVPGFLSNLVVDLRGYFDQQIALMNHLGMDYQMVQIESEATPQHNAKFITHAIISSPKPVIIVCHSKGGIDTLEALRQIYERDQALLSQVKGFIPIQSPFWGSPIADWVYQHRFVRRIAAKLLRAFGGTRESLVSLMTKTRYDYFERHRDPLLSVLKTVSTLSFASWKKDMHPLFWDTVLEWPRNIMERAGYLNDGLLPVDHGIFPAADYIKVSNVDHVDTIKDFVLSKFNRRRFFKTLLVMILKKS